MKNVLFVTSRVRDIRELCYRTRLIWKVSRVAELRATPALITSYSYDLIFFDIALEGLYAPDLLFWITSVPSHPPVFILSREYSFEFFNLARRAGVCGYFHIPYSCTSLVRHIDRFFEAGGKYFGSTDNGEFTETPESSLIGNSGIMKRLREDIVNIKACTEAVMIYGETGSGKDLVARLIHQNSPVAAGPYTPLNVSCITQSLAESMLFGTSKGSYTGAVESKGLIEEADNGTLFLDEIGELDPNIQPKFLRVLEDKQVVRVGSTKSRKVDFRLVCATNRSMEETVEAGGFRKDLFYRIDVLRLIVPPLRTHPEDIPLLSSFRLKSYGKILSNNALEKLHTHSWPGNVRQLFNCLTRGARASSSDIIYPEHIQF